MPQPPTGWFFLTLAAAERGRSLFARLLPDRFEPTALGDLAVRQWRALCAKRAGALATHAIQPMPDHLHVLFRVAEPLGHPLGADIALFKAAVTSCARRELGYPPDRPLWEPGFHCERKTTPQQVAAARLYAGRNPAVARGKSAARRRWGAAAPLSHPRLPAVWPEPAPAGAPAPAWTAFGDAALLDAPRLVAVRVSRREPEERLRRIEARAAALAREGAVLVSPALSPGEKRAFAATLRAGGRAIHLECRPIDRYYKPLGPRLSACKEGRLLALSPLSVGLPLSRPLCEALNALARRIASGAG